MSDRLAAGAAEVEEFDHRHLGVRGTKGRIARIGGQQGRIGGGGGVDGLDARLGFHRLARGQDFV